MRQEDLLAALSETDWSYVCCSNVDIKSWNVFKNNFLHTRILDKVAPIKENIKHKTEPWMNSDILENIHSRDKLLYQFKKTNDPEVYIKFYKIRNKIQRDIKKAKASYFSNKIEAYKNDPKGLWKQ